MADVLTPIPVKTKGNTDVKVVVADSAGTNLLAVDASGRITVLGVQSGTWNVRAQDGAGNALASATAAPAGTEQALVVRNIPSGTQAVSGTVTANAGTGTFAVSGTVTANAGTGTFSVNVAQVGASAVTLGAKTSAASIPVVLASDQAALTVSAHHVTNAGTFAVQAAQSGSWSVTVSGTVTVAAHAVTNAGTFAVQDSQVLADNAAFTDGTTKVFMGGYVFDETAGTALTENDAAAARIDAKRAQINIIEDGATRGRYVTVSAANALKVDGSAVTQPVSGTVTANAGTGTFTVSGTVTANAGTGTFGTNLAQIAGTTTATGNGTASAGCQRVTIASDNTAIPVATHAVTQSGTWNVGTVTTVTTVSTVTAVTTLGTITNNVKVVGPDADGAAATGAPVQVAGKDGTGAVQALRTNTDGALMVTSDATFGPKVKHAATSDLAPSGTGDVDTDNIASGKTGSLAQVVISSTVPVKAEIKTVLNGTATVVAVLITSAANPTMVWTPPAPGYHTVAYSATAGLDGFRVSFTNLEPVGGNTAAAYATIHYDEK